MPFSSRLATPGRCSWSSTRVHQCGVWPASATPHPVASSLPSPSHDACLGLLVVLHANKCRYRARNFLSLLKRLGDLRRIGVRFNVVEGDTPGVQNRLSVYSRGIKGLLAS